MDTSRLRLVAANFRFRAISDTNEYARAHDASMATYLEEVASWIEARRQPTPRRRDTELAEGPLANSE